MKILLALGFVGILGALGMAGLFMLRGGQDGRAKPGRMMRALALRVALSVLLFTCVMAGWWFGWIAPTGVPLGK